MFRQSKTLEIALCGLVLMVVVGFGFQAVNADDDKETMIQLERIAQQSDQSQSNHDSSFPLVYANTPGGITYYDDKLWVVNSFSQRVYAYSTNGTYDADASFSLIYVNDNSKGIAYGDGKFWVAGWNYDIPAFQDRGDNKIYAYNLDGTYNSDASFLLISENDLPFGITYYDDKLWVVDTTANRVYAYSTNGTYDADASFDLTSENTGPTGITYGDGKFWVVEDGFTSGLVEIYAYNLDGTYDADASFDLTSKITNPTGITYYDGKVWIADIDFDDGHTVYIYESDPSLESRVTSIETNLTGLETNMAGLETKITGLETKITNMETILTDIQTMLSSLETIINNLNTRIIALESDTQTPEPDPEPVQTTGVSGKVYTDSNDNGTLDAGESGVSGRSVIAVNLTDQTDVSRTSTDANGDYSFDVVAGGYLIQVEGTNAFAYVTILDGSVLTQNLGL